MADPSLPAKTYLASQGLPQGLYSGKFEEDLELDMLADRPQHEDSIPITDQLHLFPLPVPENIPPRPLTAGETESIETLSRLQFFLATAPTRWSNSTSSATSRIAKFQLPNGEHISCVFWGGLYHITGTDIVRALSFRFEAFGRPVQATKKWEEGVFSDLRNLKPGIDACLEEPKSALLDFLFRNGCIRTQKKQKVFYWFSVPHDRLFLDALERDLKREKAGQEPTTAVVGEPARSFRYDPRRSLYEQFAGQNPGMNGSIFTSEYPSEHNPSDGSYLPPEQLPPRSLGIPGGDIYPPHPQQPLAPPPPTNPAVSSVVYSRTLFEGSPAYKRRRVRSRATESPAFVDMDPTISRPSGISRSVSGDIPSGTETASVNRGESSRPSEDDDTPRRRREVSRSVDSYPDMDERSFVCPYDFCRRPFKRLEHLKRHVRTHTQERPFECPTCSRGFSRQDNLIQHMRTHGKGNTPQPGGDDAERRTRDWAANGPGRWATASPVGGPYQLPNQHYRPPTTTTQMLPPPAPVRHSTVPPDWPAPASATLYTTRPDPALGQVDPSLLRRHRSATPYGPAGTMQHPVPTDPYGSFGMAPMHFNPNMHTGWHNAVPGPSLAPPALIPDGRSYWRTDYAEPPTFDPYVPTSMAPESLADGVDPADDVIAEATGTPLTQAGPTFE